MKSQHYLTFGLALAGLAVVAPANATIIMVSASSIQGDNVLFNDGTQTGTTVSGFTNTTNRIVNFTGGGATLRAEGGQAKVTGDLDRSTRPPGDTINFDMLSFQLDTGNFNDLEFNLSGGDATAVNFTVIDDDGVSFFFNGLTLGSGSNFFGFQGIDGESIASISFSTVGGTGIQDIRQIRLDPDVVTAVPEPATWALMIAGFGLVGFAKRRRVSTVVA